MLKAVIPVLLVLLSNAQVAIAASCARDCRQRVAACRQACIPNESPRRCLDDCRATTGCAAGGPQITQTIAYVVNGCRASQGTWTVQQRLEIRRGDCPPVPVMEIAALDPVPDLGLCRLYGSIDDGEAGVAVGAFQRLGVSPDGRTVVFEVTGEFRAFPGPGYTPPLTSERMGIYRVHADGTGLRRIAGPSREPDFRVIAFPIPPGFAVLVGSYFTFSPDGRTVLYTDRGPGTDDSDAAQAVALDLVGRDHRRTQLTHFTASSQGNPAGRDVFTPAFEDPGKIRIVAYDRTVGGGVLYRVGRDGDHLRRVGAIGDLIQSLPGALIVPTFRVSGGRFVAPVLELPTPTALPVPGLNVREVFRFDGPNILQLTNFGRGDTLAFGENAEDHVLFAASADPVGHNPSHACQLFRVSAFGDRVRQLTRFAPAGASLGCLFAQAPDCVVGSHVQTEDRRTGSVLFDSNCDPLGSNPHHGSQLFATPPDGMRANGSRRRQLTHFGGFREDPDGSVTVEQPGPIDYPHR